MTQKLDIIIPTLNAEIWLAATLKALTGNAAAGDRLIIVDGGSSDRSRKIAASFQNGSTEVTLLDSEPGRGVQLARAAAAAGSDWLLFWHADTLPGEGWRQAVSDFQSSAPAGVAGYFRFRLDDQAHPGARRIERLVNWRCRLLGLPYGDQGLLIRRQDYQTIGGYREIRIMEDVDLVRRLGRNNLRPVTADAVTSARRYRHDGYWMRPLRNLCCLALFWCGLSPDRIARLYQ